MSDNLKWMNRHAILLREPQWANIAAKENYKIRADLRPLFDAHPDSLELLDAMDGNGLYREGCEFIARMTHRRAAVWWGYCCLLDFFAELQAVERGDARPAQPTDALEPLLAELKKIPGLDIPKPGNLTPEGIDAFCKAPEMDLRKALEFPKPPPQDRSALAAASARMKDGCAKLDSFIPAGIRDAFAKSVARGEEQTRLLHGIGSAALFDKARSAAEAGPLTYTVDRFSHPVRREVLRLPQVLEAMRKTILSDIKAAFPEKYPATPEAALLLKAAGKARSDTAVQAVWRWIVSPDERNTTLALEAGNGAAGTPEGMLAYAAAWSFGDLAPEGKTTVPVPPELPGTGLNAALVLMAMGQGGHRKMKERYERYFRTGIDVVFGRNLWTEAVSDDLSPHEMLMLSAQAAERGL